MRKRPLNFIPVRQQAPSYDGGAAFAALEELRATMTHSLPDRGIALELEELERVLLRLEDHVLAIARAGIMAHRWYGHFEHAVRHCDTAKQLLRAFEGAGALTAPQLGRLVRLVDTIVDRLTEEWLSAELPPKLRSALDTMIPPTAKQSHEDGAILGLRRGVPPP